MEVLQIIVECCHPGLCLTHNLSGNHMKICILTSVHQPFDVRIYHKEAMSLVRVGHEVSLVVSTETEPVDNNIRFLTVPQSRSRVARMTITVMRIIKLALKEQADVYHMHDPELLSAALLLKAFGHKVVYDVHEDYPGAVLSKDWLHPLVRKLVSGLFSSFEKCICFMLDGVVSATPAIHRRFQKISKNAVIVQNFPILDELKIAQETESWKEREEAVIFSGGITRLRGAVEMVSAMGKVNAGHSEATMYLAGNFVPSSLKNEVEQMAGWQTVKYCGFVSRERLAEIFGCVRAGLLVFHPAPNHTESQPNKLFEYMSAGLPVIVSDFPLWREIVEQHQCGLVVDPLDDVSIAEKIIWILDNPVQAQEMGTRGERAVGECFNWSVEEKILIKFYQKLEQVD